MKNTENLEEFYEKNKFTYIPKELENDIGHFNIFKRGNSKIKPISFNRRDFFKITLLKGKIKVDYADKSFVSEKYALMFSDPLVPYSWEPLDENQSGCFCIFTETFFHKFGSLRQYPVFQANQNKLFILDEKALKDVEKIFEKMFEEIDSDYAYKYDVLRNLCFELIHYAMKMQPAITTNLKTEDRATKIATLFTELLERQFPIESPYQRFKLRSANDFAKNLNIHTNHLNKVLKEITGKTTSELISNRVLQEAKILLKHTPWSVSDIAFSLGFEEPPHFINFFKKRAKTTPKKYRDL
ncbi:helix-turn-helix domain-containing protein [Candidatus Marinarcus aquaticus]|uniref:AraC family transcriptional regulator n=1 Tax=Candidatus Marinarcus aquaticus TaxID=2044504 RepID=A0A4Q0XM54_9BACT|nr:AraC family transcriptional regulator [Candidatus Marinarcus aquaticus]RXJ54157.1 AraC family transcriptional regulator [Candidatus Marinarcus aquaticus]